MTFCLGKMETLAKMMGKREEKCNLYLLDIDVKLKDIQVDINVKLKFNRDSGRKGLLPDAQYQVGDDR